MPEATKEQKENLKESGCWKIRRLKMAMKCHSCRKTFTEPEPSDRCPVCGGNYISTWYFNPDE